MASRLLQSRWMQGLVRREHTGWREIACGRSSKEQNPAPFPLQSRGLKGQAAAKTEDVGEGRRPHTARLVVTHSSYMDGLIPLLDRFVADPDASTNVSSVVPGRMYSCNGRSELFKMTVRVTTNGFKALARKGTAGQEVFISTTKMEIDEVKAALNRAAGFDLEKGGSRREQKGGRKRR